MPESQAAELHAFPALRGLMRKQPPKERCELCSAPLAPEHEHLVEPANRRLVCSCQACAILFSNQQNGKYRRVPRDSQVLGDFRMDDVQWAELNIPIGLAFFHHSTPAGRVVAMYPSPGGPVESQLPLEAWSDLVQANPVLKQLQPDVEALLVNRIGEAREYFRVPIDECYKLVGIIRLNWKGLSGGQEVWVEIDRVLAGFEKR